MKITFLGVWMTPDVGETVSFVLELTTGEKILVDCGTNLVKSLTDAGIDPVSISHIIITHPHGDHISGLPTFLFYKLFYSAGIRGKPLSSIQIISIEDTIQCVKKYIDIPYNNLSSHESINYNVVSVNDVLNIGNCKFRFFETNHKPTTIGFKSEVEEKSIVYSSDTAFCKEILAIADESDYLIHDVAATSKFKMLSGGHTLCDEIGKNLTEFKIGNFIPIHRISYYYNNMEPYVNELKENYGGKITIVNDGDSIAL